MPINQWSYEIAIVVFVVAFASATIGYLIAALVKSRKITQLSLERDQSQRALEVGENYLKDLQAQIHQCELSESRYQGQINSADVTEKRLSTELSEYKRQVDELRQQLDKTRDKQHQAEKQYEASQTEIRALQRQWQMTQSQLDSASKKYDELHIQFSALNEKQTKLQTEQEERSASHTREIANFEQQKASLVGEFKNLSNEILEAKSKSLQENSKLTLGAMMSPFQQSIDSFKKEVQEIHHRETKQQGELTRELQLLKTLNQKITTEAHELSTALRGQKKLQGNWGELVLENVLDRSGLQPGKDYQRELSITTEVGRQRPDVVIYLPQNKHLIIDAKVSLNAYTRYVNAEDEGVRATALKEHVRAVADRIKELSDRDYYKLPGLNSPEIVFMFIPIESAFVEALKADETLFQKAIENHVLVATPTTLLTSLNIVRQLWRYEDQNKHTAALARRAEGVFKKLNGFLGNFEKVKKGLEGAMSAYLSAENQLVSGKGNLVKQVGDFKNMAPNIKAELPDYFTDKAELEIDYARGDIDESKKIDIDSPKNIIPDNSTHKKN